MAEVEENGLIILPDNGEIKAHPHNRATTKPPKSLGRPEFDTSSLAQFQVKPQDKQKDDLKAAWADAAYILSERLKRFAMTVSRKDFGRLQQLVTSAGIAYDKVFPKGESTGAVINGNIMFNLFGSLGGEKVMRILQPPTPVYKEIPHGDGTGTDREARSEGPV